jgi:hypothetical protein
MTLSVPEVGTTAAENHMMLIVFWLRCPPS